MDIYCSLAHLSQRPDGWYCTPVKLYWTSDMIRSATQDHCSFIVKLYIMFLEINKELTDFIFRNLLSIYIFNMCRRKSFTQRPYNKSIFIGGVKRLQNRKRTSEPTILKYFMLLKGHRNIQTLSKDIVAGYYGLHTDRVKVKGRWTSIKMTA